MTQIVNTFCSLCQQRISSALDAEFCEECGSPVHNDCKTKGSSAGSECAACGADQEAGIVWKRAIEEQRLLDASRGISAHAAEDDAADAADIAYVRKKRDTLLLLVGYSGVLGVLSLFLPEENPILDLIVGLPILILAITWCYVDARQRGHVIGKPMRIALVLVLVIALPVYLFQTRGLGAFKSLVKAGLLGAVMLLLASFPSIVAWLVVR
jgi:hypothetical protein